MSAYTHDGLAHLDALLDNPAGIVTVVGAAAHAEAASTKVTFSPVCSQKIM
jgi:hypothetical protein